MHKRLNSVQVLYTHVFVKQYFLGFTSWKKMEELHISDMRVEPCVNSRFIQPSRVVFKQVCQDVNVRM